MVALGDASCWLVYPKAVLVLKAQHIHQVYYFRGLLNGRYDYNRLNLGFLDDVLWEFFFCCS